MLLPVRYRTTLGDPLISVTQILTITKQINAQWFTPESARRGQIVHDLTEVYDRGEPLNIPSELAGYLDAYATFLAQARPVYLDSEVQCIDIDRRFAGRIDRVCADLFGEPGHIDFKTGAPLPWHGEQLAGYNILRPTGVRWACYLSRTGKYRLKRYDDPADYTKFFHHLATAHSMLQPQGEQWAVV